MDQELWCIQKANDVTRARRAIPGSRRTLLHIRSVHQSMHVHLKKSSVKFHPRSDSKRRSLSFFEERCPNKKKMMSSDIDQ